MISMEMFYRLFWDRDEAILIREALEKALQ